MRAPLGRRNALRLLLALPLAACASVGIGVEDAEAPDATETEYRLGAGDRLRITVFGEADLTGEYLVSSQGNVGFPLIGDIAVANKTVPEASTAIADALRGGYVRQPNVSIDIVNYRPFFILGEVETPGSYPYSSHLTVMNAVAVAGGFSYRADRGRVFIRRANEEQERAYRLTTGTIVRPGDTIRIPERLF